MPCHDGIAGTLDLSAPARVPGEWAICNGKRGPPRRIRRKVASQFIISKTAPHCLSNNPTRPICKDVHPPLYSSPCRCPRCSRRSSRFLPVRYWRTPMLQLHSGSETSIPPHVFALCANHGVYSSRTPQRSVSSVVNSESSFPTSRVSSGSAVARSLSSVWEVVHLAPPRPSAALTTLS